jgi:hypothetical protein
VKVEEDPCLFGAALNPAAYGTRFLVGFLSGACCEAHGGSTDNGKNWGLEAE